MLSVPKIKKTFKYLSYKNTFFFLSFLTTHGKTWLSAGKKIGVGVETLTMTDALRTHCRHIVQVIAKTNGNVEAVRSELSAFYFHFKVGLSADELSR